jgi:hypothetical protein
MLLRSHISELTNRSDISNLVQEVSLLCIGATISKVVYRSPQRFIFWPKGWCSRYLQLISTIS